MAWVRGLMVAVSTLCLGTGFGHAALGRTRRGYLWFAAFIASLVLGSIWFWSFACAGAIWLGAIVDAFVCGYRTQAEPPFRWLRIHTVAIFVVSVSVAVGVRFYLLGSFSMPASSMSPTLELGDHFFIRKVGSVGRGDVVVVRYPCDPTRDYVKRVMAVGGDTVEVRCSVVYVNGTAVPAALVSREETYQDYDERDAAYFSRKVSRYRETIGGTTYDVYQDLARPERDAMQRSEGDSRDFPSRFNTTGPSCEDTDERSASEQPSGALVETKAPAAASVCEPQLHYVVPPNSYFVIGDNRSNSNDSRVWGSVPASLVKGRVIGIWWTSRPGHSTLTRFGPVH